MEQTNIFKLIRAVELFTNESIVKWRKSFHHQISITSILVLAELRANGPQKQSVLAYKLGCTPAAITNIANQLIKETYARREYDVNDRRIVLLAITEKGMSILEEAQLKGRELKQELFSVLTEEEINQFLTIHEKLLHRLEND